MTDTRPAVPPVQGHYAVLRNGIVIGPLQKRSQSTWEVEGFEKWFLSDGRGEWYNGEDLTLDVDHDIIATIPPELIAARAEIARLKTPMRLCVNCGKERPASEGRTNPGENCLSPDACTWDMTFEEAWHYFRQKCHDQNVEITRLRDALQATIDGIAWDWQGRVVGNLPNVREAAIKALETKT